MAKSKYFGMPPTSQKICTSLLKAFGCLPVRVTNPGKDETHGKVDTTKGTLMFHKTFLIGDEVVASVDKHGKALRLGKRLAGRVAGTESDVEKVKVDGGEAMIRDSVLNLCYVIHYHDKNIAKKGRYFPHKNCESGGEKYTKRNVTREMSYKDFKARNNF
jgi:hypothetical protein